MESGTFPGDPRAETLPLRVMLRVFFRVFFQVFGLSFAMLAAALGLSAAEKTAQAVNASGVPKDSSHEQSLPLQNSAAGASFGEDLAAEIELLEAANKSRELAGLPRLQFEASLRAAALEHARRMVASGRLEHQLPSEPSLLERIALAIPPDNSLKINRAGENIANASCSQGANAAIMRSEPHRKNLLDAGFNIAGIAAVWSEGRLYVVQDFAHQVTSYSAQQSRELVGRAIDETRQRAGLSLLVQRTAPNLDEATCTLARENLPNARLLRTAYQDRKIVVYTQSRPEVLSAGALRLLRDPRVRQFAVGACYARNAEYPTGIYWVAILLY